MSLYLELVLMYIYIINMIIKIVVPKVSEAFSNPLVKYLKENFPDYELVLYDESFFKDKKKAYKVKGACSARLSPFVSVYDDKKELIKAFYSEAGECTIENIIKYFNEL